MAYVPSPTYTEVGPEGPAKAGDVGGDYQSSEAWSRRFSALLPNHLYAVITVSFYIEELPPEIAERDGREQRSLTVHYDYDLCGSPGDPSGTGVWSDSSTRPVEWTGDLTEETPREACERFSPTSLTWNGAINGNHPCNISTRHHPHEQISLHCSTHPSRLGHRPARRDLAKAEFVCDEGQNWAFLIDRGTDEEPMPALVDLGGLNSALISHLEGMQYNDEPDATLRIFLYLGSGNLEQLTWEPCGEQTRDIAYSGGPMIGTRQYQVVAKTPPARTSLGPEPRVYLRTFIHTNLDA